MSKSTRTILAFCMVAFVAACGAKEEATYVDSAVSAEPSYTGKFK